MTAVDHAELKRVAEGATPGNLDTVPNPSDEYGGHSTGFYECPACGGQGEVEGATYCNFDGVALGVQFFGIGNEHKNYEAFFRAANPAVILALLSEIEGLKSKAMLADMMSDKLERRTRLLDEAERTIFALRTQAPDSWRPIETAPRDGTTILAVRAGNHPTTNEPYRQAVAWWRGGRWVETDDPDDYDDWPLSHWMPLPAPPVVQEATPSTCGTERSAVNQGDGR